MFDNLSGQTQFILTIVVIAVLFVLVSANNKRNRNKRNSRTKGDFREKIKEHRKEKEKNED